MPQAARLLAIAERLQGHAQPPRPPELRTLMIGTHGVGWVPPKVADFLCSGAPRFVGDAHTLRLVDDGLDTRSRSAVLVEAALRLRDAGLVRGWRDEALAIRARPGEALLATIERAACRALGITTEAVHLNAFADDGTLFIARRSPHKAIDPGLWDNLVGGMVPADETLEQALEREAWEEAGLELDRLEVHRGRSFQMRRPVPEGYQSEWIHVYETTLTSDTQCANQDGEVSAIEHRPLGDVVDAIERGEFTLESALVTLESLMRRDGLGSPPGLYA